MIAIHKKAGNYTLCGRFTSRVSSTTDDNQVTCKVCKSGGMSQFRSKCNSEKETQEQLIDALLTEYRDLRKRGATSYSIELCLIDKFTITRK
jgi:hypothetical protein